MNTNDAVDALTSALAQEIARKTIPLLLDAMKDHFKSLELDPILTTKPAARYLRFGTRSGRDGQ